MNIKINILQLDLQRPFFHYREYIVFRDTVAIAWNPTLLTGSDFRSLEVLPSLIT